MINSAMSFRGARGNSRGPSRGPSRGTFGGPGRGGFQGGGRSGPVQLYNPRDGATQPDNRVTELEDRLVAGFRQLPPEVHQGNFPPRRGFGTTGEKTLVRANYFPLELKPGTVFYRYQIRISPDEKKKKERRRIVDLYIKEALTRCNVAVVTDGGENLYTVEELPLADLKLADGQEFTVKLWWEDDVPAGPHERSKQFLVKIRSNGSMTAAKLDEFIKGQSRHREHGEDQEKAMPTELLQLFNIILNREPEVNMRTIGAGKNKFFELPSKGGASANLGGGLEAVQGFYKSVRPCTGRLMCNINPVAAAFYSGIPLVDIMGQFLGRGINDAPLSENERKRFSTFIGKLKVTMRHLQDKPTFVGKMSHKNSQEHTFHCDELGREVSVKEYFRAKYRMGLRFPNLQLIQAGRSFLPVEVCSIAEGQPFRNRLSETQVSNMIGFACRDPTANAQLIVNSGLKVLNLENDRSSIPWKFGVKIDPRMVVVPARILPAPTIQYQQRAADLDTGKGQWNLKAQKFVRGATINRLLVLAFSHSRERAYIPNNIDTLIAQFKESCQELGMKVSSHKIDVINAAQNVLGQLENVFRKYSGSDSKPSLMLCILPDELKSTFNQIKYYADVKAGITTVVMLFSKVSRGIERGNKQYWANLLMKINMRLGGINHTLKNPNEALKPLFSSNGAMLIIYRDGVSEGEFGRVLGIEFPKIVHACDQFEAGYRPKITLIVVGKRHHTRFYPMEADKADENKNCLPGTVVDRGITSTYDWDFFLQAHKGLQGTTKPAHYYVLRDENGFNADSLQRVTMNLCHLFARCTKAVSICPPAKFADVACDRGRVYLSNIMDMSSGGSVSSGADDPQDVERKARERWGNGIHQDLRHTMFYL
ncbi:hypothetical protein TWF696_003589 [Orbilia brochopaga]|uniref:Uncharacterized protein n=1 Tax=Orbilia brochopaga TaxID=3140254 RepID=A0AAV9TYC2_9PEZI